MGKVLFNIVLLALCLSMGTSELSHKRPTRSIDILKNLPIFTLFKEAEPEPVVEVPIPQPIFKVHRYNGIQVKPVATAVPVISNLAELEIKKKLPSLDDIKLLLGTTSNAETLDAMREMVSTRAGLELVAGYIKQYMGEVPVDITKMSQEDVGSFITKYYQYSTPVASIPQKPFVRYEVPQRPFVTYKVPQKQYGAPIYQASQKQASSFAGQTLPKVESSGAFKDETVVKPIEKYGAPPVQTYGAPMKTYSAPFEGNAAKSELVVPAQTYGAPFQASDSKAEFVAPMETYGAPFQASDSKAEFVAPMETYGAPFQASDSKAEFVTPMETYGAPFQASDSKAEFVAPMETYGVPKEESTAKSDVVAPVQTYGLPYQGNDAKADFVAPVETYGPPKEANAAKTDVIVPVETYGLPFQGNDAKADFITPVETYGPPKEENAAKSEVVAPVQSYGLPYQGNDAKADFVAPVEAYGVPKPGGVFRAEVIQPEQLPSKLFPTQFRSIPSKSSKPDIISLSQNDAVINDKLLPIVVADGGNFEQGMKQFAMPAPDKFPDDTVIQDFSPKGPTIKASDVDSIVSFPMLSELPTVEDMFKFRTEDVDEKDFNSVVIDLPFQKRTPVFSFSAMPGTVTQIKEEKPESRPNIIETKYEQPGFSYTQLSSLPLEEVAFDYSPDKVTSFGEKIPSYIFDQDSQSAASEVKPVVAKLDAKISNNDVKNVTEKHEAVTKKTETSTAKADSENKKQRRRWMPKSRRKYVAASA